MHAAPPSEELLEEVDGLSPSEIEDLRDFCRESLYFLSVGVLGYKDVNLSVHANFCRHIEGAPKRRRLSLMPRGHLKSTVGTTGDSVRLALRDPDDARVLIAGETSTLAEKFLLETKNAFQLNRLLQGLFPELIPERFTGPGVVWRNDQATIRRGSSWKEPTFQAIGVGGASVGSHFTHIKCDDLIGFDASRSPAAMAYAKAWVDTIEPLLVTPSEDIIDWIGTRWSRNDLYGHLMEGYGDSLSVYTRGAIENGELIFPQKLSWEEVERIQTINPAQWAAQYENNPLSSLNNDFPVESLRTYRLDESAERVHLTKERSWHLDELDRVLTADPNSGSLVAPDAAAISVQGVSPESEVAVLDSWSGRVSPSDFVDKIYQLARRWRVRVVGIEKAGQQNTDHYFKLKAEQEGYSVRVEALSPRGRHKQDRVRAAIQPLLRSGLLYILPSQSTLRQQISEFPDCVLWDEVDALSYGPEIWQKPEKREVSERRQGVVKKLLAMRHPRTGY